MVPQQVAFMQVFEFANNIVFNGSTPSGIATLIPVTKVGLGFRSGGQIAIN